jgi:hypothetical protein
MMLLDRHLTDDALNALAAHCDERRRAGEARTLDSLPDGLVPATPPADCSSPACSRPSCSAAWPATRDA